MPGPLSWWFHHLPMPLHRVEVAANHVAQLVVPFLLFTPQPVAGIAAAIIIVTQLWLMVSGNFAWLNAVTITLALPALGDGILGWLLPVSPPDQLADAPLWHDVVVVAVTALVAVLSYRPVANLLSPHQVMNTAFDPLRLVNTYGAFGSITRVRREVIVEGTSDGVVTPSTEWREYEFKGKPGDPHAPTAAVRPVPPAPRLADVVHPAVAAVRAVVVPPVPRTTARQRPRHVEAVASQPVPRPAHRSTCARGCSSTASRRARSDGGRRRGGTGPRSASTSPRCRLRE